MHSKKRASLGAAVLSVSSMALAVGVASGTSWAKAPGPIGSPVNVSDYTLSCASVVAKLSFNPVLKQPGPSGAPDALAMKLKAASCSASAPPAGGPPVSVSKVNATGILTIPNDSCPGFQGGGTLSGTMTMKYKTPHGSAPLASGSQTTVVTPGSFSVAVNGAVLVFKAPGPAGLPGVQSSGAFIGTNGGKGSMVSLNNQDFQGARCSAPSGLKSVKFTSGSLFLG